MASNRHLGRIVALQSLYEYEFHSDTADVSVDDIINRNLERYEDEIEDKKFVFALVNGVRENVKDLDEKIQPMAPEWPLDQISRIDINVLRLGLFELLHLKDEVPPRVAINEAVELAKSFGSDNSSKFINGVLGTAYRTLVEGESTDDGKEN